MRKSNRLVQRLLITTIVCALLVCAGFGVVLEVPALLLLGWISFLRHTLPQVQVNGVDVLLGLVAVLLFIIGSHRLIRAVVREYARKHTAEDPDTDAAPVPAWPLSRTIALTMILLLGFAAGTAMVGITHQVVWMAQSDKPLLVPRGREAARRNSSLSNLKQLDLGMHNYHDVHGHLPTGQTTNDQGEPLHGWLTQLLPYVEETALYNQIDLSQPWAAEKNKPAFQTMVDIYLNPGIPEPRASDAPEYAASHYAANRQVVGLQPAMKLRDIRDGIAKTILAGEVASQSDAWGSTRNYRDPALGINQSPEGFGGPWKAGGANLLMADGSVRFFAEDVDPEVLKALATPAGGEPLLAPDD